MWTPGAFPLAGKSRAKSTLFRNSVTFRDLRRASTPSPSFAVSTTARMLALHLGWGPDYFGGVTIRLKDNGIEPVSFVASWELIEKTKDGQNPPSPTSGPRYGGIFDEALVLTTGRLLNRLASRS